MHRQSVSQECAESLRLLLQTIFDAFNHSNLHWAFALAFFICLVISGIANLTEIAGMPCPPLRSEPRHSDMQIAVLCGHEQVRHATNDIRNLQLTSHHALQRWQHALCQQ